MVDRARGPGLVEPVLMALHEGLDRLFFAHRRALLDRDFARAARELDRYRSALLLHMQDEEELVLPVYAARGGDRTDAPVKLFLGEHDKMRAFVEDFVRRVAELRQRPDDRALLELFDREATYKNLVLHHDLRERNALYPRLSEWLDGAEQEGILARLRCTVVEPD
jgi:hemerythrin-like domain-containing protein